MSRFFSTRPLLLALLALGSSACHLPPPAAPLSAPAPVRAEVIHLAQQDAANIAQRVWLNESSGKIEGLTAWNRGEHFPSFGIGHFIWYPPGQDGPFDETFPGLLQYLQEQGVAVPTWLLYTPDSPWQTREEFLQAFETRAMQEVRSLMLDTLPQQVDYMIRRLERSLPKILAALPTQAERDAVERRFYLVARSGQGVYALLDYVNFKGEGVSPSERYQGQGWGLLQVLQAMPDTPADPVAAFADAAEKVLTRRVQNAPRDRNEGRWLLGWMNRIQTYRR